MVWRVAGSFVVSFFMTHAVFAGQRCTDLFGPAIDARAVHMGAWTVLGTGLQTRGQSSMSDLASKFNFYIFRGDPSTQVRRESELDLHLVDGVTVIRGGKSTLHRIVPTAQGKEVIDGYREVMESLYDSFAAQGPERRGLLPEIRRQDASEGDLTTHFLSIDEWSSLHSQVLVASQLHVEAQWGAQLGSLVRRGDERVGEFGRLHHSRKDGWNSEMSRESSYSHLSDLQFTMRQWFHFRKMMTWSLQVGRLDRVLMQVNPLVYRTLLKSGVRLDFGQRVEVIQDWTDAATGSSKSVKEYVISLDRMALMKLEEDLILKTFIAESRFALEQAHPLDQTYWADRKKAVAGFVRVDKELWPALRRMGLFELTEGSEKQTSLALAPPKMGSWTGPVPIFQAAEMRSDGFPVFRWNESPFAQNEQIVLMLSESQMSYFGSLNLR